MCDAKDEPIFSLEPGDAGLGAVCHAFDIKLPPLPGTVAVRWLSDGALIAAPQRRAA
jgi:hypothetical protein